MMIGVRCRCGSHLRVAASAIGKPGKCPFCQAKLKLVAPEFTEDDRFAGALILEQGPGGTDSQWLLGGHGAIELGKLSDKAIVLPGRKVSRSHCRLIPTETGWQIEDQNSTNGLYVNGVRLARHDLSDGDLIQIGEYSLRYLDTSLPAAAAVLEDSPAPSQAETEDESAPLSEDLYRLTEGEIYVPTPEPQPGSSAERPKLDSFDEMMGPVCSSCGKRLKVSAKICIDCGIDLKTGRSILTSHAAEVDTIHTRATRVIWVISWLISFGIYPIASEAFGTRKPYFIRAIAIITVLTSIWFWAYEWSDSPAMRTVKNRMLWCGNGQPTAEDIVSGYLATRMGDREAFSAKAWELKGKPGSVRPFDLEELDRMSEKKARKLLLDAHNALPPEQQYMGQPAASQLITHAFLHAGILHLVGNLVFLLVIGSRVNALLGNVVSALLYPVLGVAAALMHMIAVQNEGPCPCVGASGAIMGLAGVYIILMPMHKVHMAVWFRWPLFLAFHLHLKLFAVRGFWVVLFYMAFDVFSIAFGSDDGVASWAHVGGFVTGMGVGLLLLLTKLVNARGGDILSGFLGRRAWAYLGKPDASRKAPIERLP
jgi:membrane associated rhomboid family serine protease